MDSGQSYRDLRRDAKCRNWRAKCAITAAKRPARSSVQEEMPWRCILRSARRRHLVRRQARAAGRTPRSACADAWAALCQRRVRGRARLWRRDLQVHRAFRAAEALGAASSTSRFPIRSPRSTPPSGWCSRSNGQQGRLCPPDRLARLARDGRLGAEQHDPPRHRDLGVAELFRSGAAAEGHPARPRRISPARSAHRAVHAPRPPAST